MIVNRVPFIVDTLSNLSHLVIQKTSTDVGATKNANIIPKGSNASY